MKNKSLERTTWISVSVVSSYKLMMLMWNCRKYVNKINNEIEK
jgi:hypothetical protein